MTLDEYMKDAQIDRARMAEAIGVSEVSICRYLARKRIPKPEVMTRIVRATGGRVQPNDFFAVAEA